MRKREKRQKKKTPQARLSAGSIILHVLAWAGITTFRQVTLSSLAQNEGSHLRENSYYTAMTRLRRRGMISKDEYGYALTPRGEWQAMKAVVQRGMMASSTAEQGRWDGKWRIVLFDFPEGKRPYRDYVRTVLKRYGFRELQRSTWIWPYKLPAYLVNLFNDAHLKKYIRHITSHDINYDKDLRRRFKLI